MLHFFFFPSTAYSEVFVLPISQGNFITLYVHKAEHPSVQHGFYYSQGCCCINKTIDCYERKLSNVKGLVSAQLFFAKDVWGVCTRGTFILQSFLCSFSISHHSVLGFALTPPPPTSYPLPPQVLAGRRGPRRRLWRLVRPVRAAVAG